MKRQEPILIGDMMRQMGIVRADNSVDRDLVCALFYYEQQSEVRHLPIPDDLLRLLADFHKL